MTQKARNLEPGEQRVNQLIQKLHHAYDNRIHVVPVTMPNEAIATISKYAIAKPLKLVPSKDKGHTIAYFTTEQLKRYVERACSLVGFTLMLDWSVKTHDGLFIFPTDTEKK